MNDSQHNDELRDAPGLRDLKRSDPFAVPEGFFEQFPHRVQQRVVQLEGRQARYNPFAKWTWYGAAALAVLALGIYFLQPGVPTSTTNGQEEGLTLNVEPDEIEMESWDQLELYADLEEGEPGFVATELEGDELTAYIEHEELPLDLILEEL